jgi:MFS family permease
MVYLSIIFFAAGSLLGALAGNFTVLIAGRTIQGIGGGGLTALTEVRSCFVMGKNHPIYCPLG